jgi:hypothetical protein
MFTKEEVSTRDKEKKQEILEQILSEYSPNQVKLLEQVLCEYTPAEQVKMMLWVWKLRVPPNDPLFLILLALGKYQFLLEQAPKELNGVFDDQYERLVRTISEILNNSSRGAVKSQQAAIAAAANTLLSKAQLKQQFLSNSIFTSWLPASGMLTAALGIGVLLGLSVPYWLGGGYVKDKLTVAQVQDLDWAQSYQGKLAKNLVVWNAQSLKDWNCLDDVRKLQVTLKIQGKSAKGGYCVLWVVPPTERSFVSK